MKNLAFTLIILLSGFFLFSCNKLTNVAPHTSPDNTSNTTTTTTTTTTANQPIVPINTVLLTGDWQVINDTSTTVPWGLWAGHPITTGNYIGQPADYYKFTADGHTYTRINGVIDTGTFTISQDTMHVVYTYFNENETSTGMYNSFWEITNVTAHTATVTTLFVSPETATTSVTYLRR